MIPHDLAEMDDDGTGDYEDWKRAKDGGYLDPEFEHLYENEEEEEIKTPQLVTEEVLISKPWPAWEDL